MALKLVFNPFTSNFDYVDISTSNTYTITAGENLAADDAIYICNSTFDQVGGVSRVVGDAYKLDVTNIFRYIYAGIVQAATLSGNIATIQVVGDIGGWTGLPIGLPIYASITTPGSYQTTAPTPNNLIMTLGITQGVATDLLINGALGTIYMGTLPSYSLYTASTGYSIMGLNASTVPVTSVDKINFSNDTISGGTAMPTPLRGGASVASSIRFYTMGGETTGGTLTSNVDYYQFSNDTTGAAAHLLTATAFGDSGVNSSIAGYAAGDAAGPSVIYKLTFSGETTSTLSATIPATARQAPCGCETPTIGYWFGGQTGGSPVTDIKKLLFAGETTANVSATLPTATSFEGMYTSTTRIYLPGGDDGSGNGTTQIQYMNISNETTGTLAAVLLISKGLAAGCWSGAKGYNLGGITTGSTPSINVEALTFSNETNANIVATLSVARWEAYASQR